MENNTLHLRATLEQAIRTKASAEPAFRAQLTEDPAKALKAAFDLDVPAGFTIRVVTEAAGEMVLALPSPRGELNDDELDAVPGAGMFDELLDRFRPPIGSRIGQLPIGRPGIG
ncbi:hypothetical protein [Rhizobium sp. RU36D]|uniref:hypothetical protein n=1 Tax=Rhizobium sp. RU36D TaxID=1907415 RepID=UPI0009D88C8E|nr:hypothetical protein [Rhizobium sp. RU36D]SMD07417.1 NHLP leader peptide domain-containing protein [Rhizobium sp. RU36D]